MNTDFIEYFYQSCSGKRLLLDVVKKVNNDILGKKTLLIGGGRSFLEHIEGADLYYAIPNGMEIIHWPSIRPFRTVVVDEMATPFLPNTWDIVIIVHFIEFSENYKKIIKEMYRILKVNGKLITVLYNKNSLLGGRVEAVQVDDIVASLVRKLFSINKICGANKNFNFWPHRFSFELNQYNEAFVRAFPFFSDVVTITAEKLMKSPEIVGSLEQGYEMS